MAKLNLEDELKLNKYEQVVKQQVVKNAPVVEPLNVQKPLPVSTPTGIIQQQKPDLNESTKSIKGVEKTIDSILLGIGQSSVNAVDYFAKGQFITDTTEKVKQNETAWNTNKQLPSSTPIKTVQENQPIEYYYDVKNQIEQKYGTIEYGGKKIVNEDAMSDSEKKLYKSSIQAIVGDITKNDSNQNSINKIKLLQGEYRSTAYDTLTKNLDNEIRKNRELGIQIAETSIRQAKEMQELNDKYEQYNLSDWQNKGAEVGNAIGRMAPLIVASSLTGNISPLLGSITSSTLMYAQVNAQMQGQLTLQFLQQGKTIDESIQLSKPLSMLFALTEVGTEALSGGLGGLGEGIVDTGFKKIAKNVLTDTAIGQKMATSLVKIVSNKQLLSAFENTLDLLGEGGEEWISEQLGYAYMTMANLETRSKKEMTQDSVDAFIMGMFTSGVLKGQWAVGGKLIQISSNIVLDSMNIDKKMSGLSDEGKINLIKNYIPNRNIEFKDGGENYFGEFDETTGTIYLPKGTQNPLSISLVHEYTHTLQVQGKYEEYNQFVKDFYDKFYKGGYQARFNEIAKNYKTVKGYLEKGSESFKQSIEDEVVAFFTADFVFKTADEGYTTTAMLDYVFNNKKGLGYFVNDFYNQLQSTNNPTYFDSYYQQEIPVADNVGQDINSWITNARELLKTVVEEQNTLAEPAQRLTETVKDKNVYDTDNNIVQTNVFNSMESPFADLNGNIRRVDIYANNEEKSGYIDSKNVLDINYKGFASDYESIISDVASELGIEDIKNISKEDAEKMLPLLIGFDAFEYQQNKFVAKDNNFVFINQNGNKEKVKLPKKQIMMLSAYNKFDINMERMLTPLDSNMYKDWFLPTFSQENITKMSNYDIDLEVDKIESEIQFYEWDDEQTKKEAEQSVEEYRNYLHNIKGRYAISRYHDANGNPLSTRQNKDLKSIDKSLKKDNKIIPFVHFSQDGTLSYDDSYNNNSIGFTLFSDEWKPLTDSSLWKMQSKEYYPLIRKPIKNNTYDDISQEQWINILDRYKEKTLEIIKQVKIGSTEDRNFFEKEFGLKIEEYKIFLNEIFKQNTQSIFLGKLRIGQEKVSTLEQFNAISDALFSPRVDDNSVITSLSNYFNEAFLSKDIHVKAFLNSIYAETGLDGISTDKRTVAFFPWQLSDIENTNPYQALKPEGRRLMLPNVDSYDSMLIDLIKESNNYNQFIYNINEEPSLYTPMMENGQLDYDEARTLFELIKLRERKPFIRLVQKQKAKEEINNSNIKNELKLKWGVESISTVKPLIWDEVYDNDILRSSMLSIMYYNYLDFLGLGQSNLSFEEFLDMPITLYRGQKSYKTLIPEDRFVSYSLSSSIALDFTMDNPMLEPIPDDVDSITVKPIDTFGMYNSKNSPFYNEFEVLVPRTIVKETSQKIAYMLPYYDEYEINTFRYLYNIQKLSDEEANKVTELTQNNIKNMSYREDVQMIDIRWLIRFSEYNRLKQYIEEDYSGNRNKFDDLYESIKNEGFKESLFIEYNPNNGFVRLGEGNHRLGLALMMGLKELPVRAIRSQYMSKSNRGFTFRDGEIKPNANNGTWFGATGKPLDFIPDLNNFDNYKVEHEIQGLRKKGDNLYMKVSGTDNQGRTLTNNQKDFFANVSRHMFDDNGNLITIYHRSNIYTTFTENKGRRWVGTGGILSGSEMFFTDSRFMASSYGTTSEKITNYFPEKEMAKKLVDLYTEEDYSQETSKDRDLKQTLVRETLRSKDFYQKFADIVFGKGSFDLDKIYTKNLNNTEFMALVTYTKDYEKKLFGNTIESYGRFEKPIVLDYSQEESARLFRSLNVKDFFDNILENDENEDNFALVLTHVLDKLYTEYEDFASNGDVYFDATYNILESYKQNDFDSKKLINSISKFDGYDLLSNDFKDSLNEYITKTFKEIKDAVKFVVSDTPDAVEIYAKTEEPNFDGSFDKWEIDNIIESFDKLNFDSETVKLMLKDINDSWLVTLEEKLTLFNIALKGIKHIYEEFKKHAVSRPINTDYIVSSVKTLKQAGLIDTDSVIFKNLADYGIGVTEQIAKLQGISKYEVDVAEYIFNNGNNVYVSLEEGQIKDVKNLNPTNTPSFIKMLTAIKDNERIKNALGIVFDEESIKNHSNYSYLSDLLKMYENKQININELQDFINLNNDLLNIINNAKKQNSEMDLVELIKISKDNLSNDWIKYDSAVKDAKYPYIIFKLIDEQIANQLPIDLEKSYGGEKTRNGKFENETFYLKIKSQPNNKNLINRFILNTQLPIETKNETPSNGYYTIRVSTHTQGYYTGLDKAPINYEILLDRSKLIDTQWDKVMEYATLDTMLYQRMDEFIYPREFEESQLYVFDKKDTDGNILNEDIINEKGILREKEKPLLLRIVLKNGSPLAFDEKYGNIINMTKIDSKNLNEDEYQKYVYAMVSKPLVINGKKEISIFKPLLKQINEDNYKIVLSKYEEQLKDYISREKLDTAFDFSQPDIIDLLKHSIDAQFTYQEFLDYIKKNYEIQKDGKDYHSDFAKEVLQLLGYDAIVDDKVYISHSVLGDIKRSNIILLNQNRLIDAKVDKPIDNTLKMIPSLLRLTEEEKDSLQSKIDEMFTVPDGDVRYGNFVTKDGKVLDTIYHDMISNSGVKLWDAMGLLGNVRFTTYDISGTDFNFIQMYKKPTEQAINKLMDIVNNEVKNTWLVMWDYDNPDWEEKREGDGSIVHEPKLFDVPSIKNQAEFVSAINAYYSKEKGITKYFLTNKTTIDEYRSSSLEDRDSLFKNVKNGNYRTFFVDAVNTKRAIALSKMFYREANQFEINRANEIMNKHRDSLPQEQINKNKESVVISDELVDLAIKELGNSGGFSINQDKLIVNPEWKKQEAEKGYITEGKKYVAVRHVTEVSNKDFDENNKEQFKEYLTNAFASVRFSDEYVGGWVDNGKIFIDISVGLEGDSQRIDTHKIASIIGNRTFTTSGDTEYSYYDAKTGMFIKLNQDKTPEKFIYNVFGGAFINSPDTILNEVEKNKELKITRNSFNQTAVEAGLWAVIDKKVDKLVENGEMTHIVASDKQAIEYARKKVGITLDDTNEQAIEKLRTAKIQLLEKIDSDLRLDKNDFGLGVYLLQKFNEYKRSNDFIEVLAGMDEVYVQYGQGIQSATLVNKLSAEGQLIVLKRMIKKINDTYQKMNKDIVVKFDSNLVDKLLGETDLERIARIVDEIKDDIASQMPSTFMDKVNAWRYLSMLGSPKTHIRNILGNMTMIPMMATKNVLGIAMEKMIPQSDRVKSVLNRASSKDVALMDFARKTFDEYSVGSYNLGLSKTNKYSERNDLDQRRQIFKTEALESLRVFIGDALSNVDDWFARKHFVAEFAMAMKAKGLTEETITEEQTLALAEYSMQQAKIATYNDANNLAKTLNKIEKSGGMGGFLVATTLPFKRTPLNILRRAVEFSPFGIITGLNMFRGLTTGKYTVTQIVDRLASGLTGTGLMFVGAYLYQAGLLTVGADDDESEKERIYGYALGKQRYSIVIDGKSYTIDWLAPAVIPIIMGGELQKLMSENENGLDSIFNYAPEVLAGTFDPIFELTLLRGLSDTLNSYKQGAGVVSDMLTTASANYVTQFVPTILGQVARSIDDTVRSTYVPNKDTLSGIVDETVRKIKSRIPYLSTENEPMIDIRGQEITQGGTLFTRLLQNMLSPSYIKEQKITNVDREILRLMEITDKTTVIPRFPSKTVTIDGTDYPLTSEEYTKFSKDLGQTSYDILNELIYNKEYNRMSTEDKENIFYDVYNYASAYSKYELNKGYSDTSYEKIKNAEDYGIKTVDYLITKRVYDTLTSDDTMSKKEKFTNYLMATGHKDDYILYLWLVGGYKIGE